MINEIIQYFKSIINDCNPNLRYDGMVLGNELTAFANIESSYKLLIGSITSTRQDTTINATLPVTVVIWEVINPINREVDFVQGYERAIEIQASASYQPKVQQIDRFIKAVNSSTITPENENSNDNLLRITIEFTVNVSYKIDQME